MVSILSLSICELGKEIIASLMSKGYYRNCRSFEALDSQCEIERSPKYHGRELAFDTEAPPTHRESFVSAKNTHLTP